jgi:hypothetical protein
MLKTVSSITNAIGALNYKGTWDASTNTPIITSSVGVKGDYYVVSVGGATVIDGISNWGVGDWITFNGSVWQRVEGGADLNGVNLSVAGTTTLSALTASTALALDASKNVLSVTNTGTGNNVLATSPEITTPKIVTSINDANGNELFGFTATGSAVNELTVANAAAANPPTLSSTGSDTNINISITPKGTGGVAIGTSSTAGYKLVISDGATDMACSPSGGAGIVGPIGSQPLLLITGNTQRVRIGTAGEVFFPGVGTTASAANAFLNSASTPAINQLLRSTSSIRYKTDVETVETPFADKVLDLRPVWYRSKAEADNKAWSWYGLIAEEVAEVEPRLVHWSYPESAYEEVTIESDVEGEEAKTERKLKEDAELVPDGVQYERLSVLLLDVVKRQQEAINDLKARLDAANL